MLNEWDDRDPDQGPPKRWHVVVMVVVGALAMWGTGQAVWRLIAG